MNNTVLTPDEILEQLIGRYPSLEVCRESIYSSFRTLCDVYENGGTLFIAGNGGSAADSSHISGELMKSFLFRRPVDENFSSELSELFGDEGEQLASKLEGGLPAVSLPSLISISTAVSNDMGGELIFAQMISAVSHADDCFLAISTSGNSRNIELAAMAAKAKKLRLLALTGKKRCRLDDICGTVMHMPETETFKVQELHLPVYHALCAMTESYFFAEGIR